MQTLPIIKAFIPAKFRQVFKILLSQYPTSWPSKCGPLTNNISIAWELEKKLQNLRLHSRPTESESAFNRIFRCTSKCDCSKQSAALSRAGTAGGIPMSSSAQLISRKHLIYSPWVFLNWDPA